MGVIVEMETELTFTKDGVTIKVPLDDAVPFLKGSSHIEHLTYDQLPKPITMTVNSVECKKDENGNFAALVLKITTNQPAEPTTMDIKDPDRIEFTLNQGSIDYYLIPLHKANRRYFPPYKIFFDLYTNVGLLQCYVGGDSASVKPGDPDGGYYIIKDLKPWFQKNNIKAGDKASIEVIERGKKYRLIEPTKVTT